MSDDLQTRVAEHLAHYRAILGEPSAPMDATARRDSWREAPRIPATLPPCPHCGDPGDERHAWGPFSHSHLRVRTDGSERQMICCRCSRRFVLDFRGEEN